jgi:nitroimidazol reductase NimA-like FMN-containing flavoprotein (pyridoxamine 5'-phosphate oxidase superfamily)
METGMREKAVSILAGHAVMAIATIRPDGWPQATMVGYVNAGLELYFLISRSSQKFLNLRADDRVSIAIGSDGTTPETIEGLSLAGHASEVRDQPYRSQFSRLLAERHPGYFKPEHLNFKASALMRARPSLISIVDFSAGLGHSDQITVGAEDIVEMAPARADNWGANPKPQPVL